MVYQPSTDEARAHAEMAMEYMQRYDIAATPDNFHVWYTYVAGENGALCKAIDIIRTNMGDFGPARCRELFHQFFTPDQEAQEIANTAREVQRSIRQVLDFVAEMGKTSDNYDATLKEVTGTLLDDLSVDEIRSLLDGLIAETEKMQRSNENLKRELHESTVEITALRENLTTARIESLTDSLTGLANRKQFDQNMRKAVLDSMETGEDLALILVDVDHFKQFNDKWGHLLGDQVLKLIGAILQKSVAEIDTAARFGGEEFVVLLRGTSVHDAVSLAETIRAEISSRKAKKRDTGETIGRITCSFGVATFQPGEPISELIGRADRALYEAKRTGRNKVVNERMLPDAAAEDAKTTSAA